jgi:hypothetical protein
MVYSSSSSIGSRNCPRNGPGGLPIFTRIRPMLVSSQSVSGSDSIFFEKFSLIFLFYVLYIQFRASAAECEAVEKEWT